MEVLKGNKEYFQGNRTNKIRRPGFKKSTGI